MEQADLNLLVNKLDTIIRQNNPEVVSLGLFLNSGELFNYKGKQVQALTGITPGESTLIFRDSSSNTFYAIAGKATPAQNLNERQILYRHTRPNRRRSTEVAVGPWLGADVGGYTLTNLYYVGLHLGLRSPGKSNIIVYRGSEFDNFYNLDRFIVNSMAAIDKDGDPHCFFISYDREAKNSKILYADRQGFSISNLDFSSARSGISASRSCNNWLICFPDEIANEASLEDSLDTSGFITYLGNERVLQSFRIENTIYSVPPIKTGNTVIGHYKFEGNIPIESNSDTATFSFEHYGSRPDILNIEINLQDLSTPEIIENFELYPNPSDLVLDPEQYVISEDYVPPESGPWLTDSEVNFNFGGNLYRSRLNLTPYPDVITIALAINNSTFFVFYEDVIVQSPLIPIYSENDFGIIGVIPTIWVVLEPPNEDDLEGHKGYLSIYFRHYYSDPTSWFENLEKLEILGRNPEGALFTEGNRSVEATLPMLVNQEEALKVLEVYSGTSYSRSNDWYPFADPETEQSKAEGEMWWVENRTIEKTVLIRDNTELLVDGSPKFYIVGSSRQLPTDTILVEDQTYTLNFATEVPVNLYNPNFNPLLLGWFPGKEFGFINKKVDLPNWSQPQEEPIKVFNSAISRNVPLSSSIEKLNEKLSPGAKVYGEIYGQAFKGEVVSCDWEWLPVGSIVPNLNGNIVKLGMRSGAVFIIKNFSFKVTKVLGNINAYDLVFDFQTSYVFRSNEPNPLDYNSPRPGSAFPSNIFITLDGSIRNIYRSAAYTNGSVINVNNPSSFSDFVSETYYNSYAGVQILWRDPYIWVIDKTLYPKLQRFSDSNKLFVKRFKLNYESFEIKCEFDDLETLPEPYGPFNVYDCLTLDKKLLK